MRSKKVWLRYTVADGPDVFAMPETGLLMEVEVTFSDGMWHARTNDAGMEWLGQSDNREAALLDLLAVRLGLPS